jgi:hypothetical protein
MHDREQPGPKIGAGLPESRGSACPAQIVGPFAVSRERPRIASQSRDLLFDEPVKFRAAGKIPTLLPLLAHTDRGALWRDLIRTM